MTRRLRFLAALPRAIAATVVTALARLGERTVTAFPNLTAGDDDA